MNIALVHDQLFEFGGAERVFFALKRLYPHADVYTAFYDGKKLEKHAPEYRDWNIHVSWAARIPFIKRLYSPLRFLAPYIWESFDFSKYDVVISSSGWFMCKGIKTSPPTIHFSYIHHQPRYLYYYVTAMEWQRYLPIKIYAHIINHFLRMWDFTSTARPDVLIANSEETKRRIQHYYRRDSDVIYPPVDIVKEVTYEDDTFDDREYYISLCRLQKAKHVDVLVEAANKEGFALKVVGVGKEMAALKKMAGPNVEFLGRVPDKEFRRLFRGAKGYLFASEDEEFGISAVEAMGYYVPVIVYASGGIKENVIDGVCGYHYHELSSDAVIEKVRKLERLNRKDYRAMCYAAREHAEQYSVEEFEKHVERLLKKHGVDGNEYD